MKERLFKTPPTLSYVGKIKNDNSPTEGVTELLFFSRSGSTVTVGENTLSPKSGDLLIIDGLVDFDVDLKDLPEGAVTFMSVGGAKLYSGDGLAGEELHRLLPTGEQRGIMESTLRQLLRESENKTPTSSILTGSLTDTIMTLTARLLPLQPMPRRTSQVFELAKKYFDENYLVDETIVDVCKKLGVDRYRLTRIFSQEMGMPPVKYLITKRMDLAKHLLETTNSDINCIAKECGYHDTTYFCRIFKQTQGKTALMYRAQYKQNLSSAEKEAAATND